MATPVLSPAEEAAALAEIEKARTETEKIAKALSDDPNAPPPLPALNVEALDLVSDPLAMGKRDTSAAFAELERLGLPIDPGDPVGKQVLEHINEGRQLSADEYRLAQIKLDQFLRDKVWIQRLMDGDRQANREFQVAHAILLNGPKVEAK